MDTWLLKQSWWELSLLKSKCLEVGIVLFSPLNVSSLQQCCCLSMLRNDWRPQNCSVLTGSKLCSLFCPCHWWGCAVQQNLFGDLGVWATRASSIGAEVRCVNGTRFAKLHEVLWLAVGDVWLRQIPAAFCLLADCWGSLRKCRPTPHEWLGGSWCVDAGLLSSIRNNGKHDVGSIAQTVGRTEVWITLTQP